MIVHANSDAAIMLEDIRQAIHNNLIKCCQEVLASKDGALYAPDSFIHKLMLDLESVYFRNSRLMVEMMVAEAAMNYVLYH